MKKSYLKPQIVFDSFMLSESIATHCTAISHQAEKMCAVQLSGSFGDMSLFYSEVPGCTTTTPSLLDTVCYDVPNDTRNVFSS